MADSLEDLAVTTHFFYWLPDWRDMGNSSFPLNRRILTREHTKTEILNITDDEPIELSFGFKNLSKSEETTLLQFFIARRARVGRFWVPSHSTDFQLKETISESGLVAVIQDDGFDKIFQAKERVFFRMLNGDYVTRKITSVTSGPAAKELSLTLATPVDREITPTSYYAFGQLYRVRFDIDNFDIRYNTDDKSTINLRFKELPREYEL